MALDYKVVGNRIKERRRQKRYTQKKLSNDLGISTAYMSRIERGSGHPNLKRLIQISEVLDVPLGYFFTGTVEDKDDYLSVEFKETLEKCSPERQKTILKIAKLVSKIK